MQQKSCIRDHQSMDLYTSIVSFVVQDPEVQRRPRTLKEKVTICVDFCFVINPMVVVSMVSHSFENKEQ